MQEMRLHGVVLS